VNVALSAVDEAVTVVLERAAARARAEDGDKSFLERRLSSAVVHELECVFGRDLVRETRKLQSTLPGWNPPPGPIDVAVVHPDNTPRLAFELKVDDVEWTLWDLFKMVGITETPGGEAAYLACAMPQPRWAGQRECVELFREPETGDPHETEWHSCFLFREYARSWADLLKGGTGRLTDVSELVFITWLGRWSMANYPGYELRAIRVSGLSGDQRLHFRNDWPIPYEVTLGLITNGDLRVEHVPAADASEIALHEFALTFDGYRELGSTARLARLANPAIERWRSSGQLPETLTDLRACLFFEQRRWHHFGEGFDEETMRYARALIERVREELA
jgi:hypothetical protein